MYQKTKKQEEPACLSVDGSQLDLTQKQLDPNKID
jgi:hypothetical protein